jgi:CheY-like chemotaxis protein
MQVAEDITTYGHGEGALAHLKSSCMDENEARVDCPDLVLLDLNMPIMNGIELLDQLDNLKANHIIQSRVVVLTSSSYSQDIEKTNQKFAEAGVLAGPGISGEEFI